MGYFWKENCWTYSAALREFYSTASSTFMNAFVSMFIEITAGFLSKDLPSHTMMPFTSYMYLTTVVIKI